MYVFKMHMFDQSDLNTKS